MNSILPSSPVGEKSFFRQVLDDPISQLQIELLELAQKAQGQGFDRDAFDKYVAKLESREPSLIARAKEESYQAAKGMSIDPDITTDETQLFWAAFMLREWVGYQRQKQSGVQDGELTIHNPVRQPFYQNIVDNPLAQNELLAYAEMLSANGRSSKTTLAYGSPLSWFYFDPSEDHVNLDIFHSLVFGLPKKVGAGAHTRAVGLHEIWHAILTKKFPEPMRRAMAVIEEIQHAGIYRALGKGEIDKAIENNVTMMLWSNFMNLAEDNTVNRAGVYTGQGQQGHIQDISHSLKYIYALINRSRSGFEDFSRNEWARYVNKGRDFIDKVADRDPMERFKAIAQVIGLSVPMREGLAPNTRAGWEEVGLNWNAFLPGRTDEEKLDAIRDITSRCDDGLSSISHTQPYTRPLSEIQTIEAEDQTVIAREIRFNKYSEARNKLMEELWRDYVAPLLPEIIAAAKKQAYQNQQDAKNAKGQKQSQQGQPGQQQGQDSDQNQQSGQQQGQPGQQQGQDSGQDQQSGQEQGQGHRAGESAMEGTGIPTPPKRQMPGGQRESNIRDDDPRQKQAAGADSQMPATEDGQEDDSETSPTADQTPKDPKAAKKEADKLKADRENAKKEKEKADKKRAEQQEWERKNPEAAARKREKEAQKEEREAEKEERRAQREAERAAREEARAKEKEKAEEERDRQDAEKAEKLKYRKPDKADRLKEEIKKRRAKREEEAKRRQEKEAKRQKDAQQGGKQPGQRGPTPQGNQMDSQDSIGGGKGAGSGGRAQPKPGKFDQQWEDLKGQKDDEDGQPGADGPWQNGERLKRQIEIVDSDDMPSGKRKTMKQLLEEARKRGIDTDELIGEIEDALNRKVSDANEIEYDYPDGDWSNYQKNKEKLSWLISMIYRRLEELWRKQVEKKVNMTPDREERPTDDQFIDRLDFEAHERMAIKAVTGQRVEGADRQRFKIDEIETKHPTPEIVVLIDGSGSMGQCAQNGRAYIDIAISVAAALYEGVRVLNSRIPDQRMPAFLYYAGIWGPSNPRWLVLPETLPEQAGRNFEAFRGGLNSGTDFAPAVTMTAEQLHEGAVHIKPEFLGSTEVFIVSDGDIADPAASKQALTALVSEQKNVHVHLLMLDNERNSSMEQTLHALAREYKHFKFDVTQGFDPESLPIECLKKLETSLGREIIAEPAEERREGFKKAANRLKAPNPR